MDMYLEAVGTNGEQLEIGAYSSPVVPRTGEKIALRLTPSVQSGPYPKMLLFRVCEVRYAADNHMQTESWFRPYPFGQESVSVGVLVAPESEDAKDYTRRMTEASNRSMEEAE